MSFDKISGMTSACGYKNVRHYILDKNNMKAVNMSRNPTASAVFLTIAESNADSDVLILHVDLLDYDEAVKAETQTIFDFFNKSNNYAAGLFLNKTISVKKTEEFILKIGGKAFSSKAVKQAPEVTQISMVQEL